ncbi:MAG TPA: condensation domain-containing protein, partial [Thermoanaerobaculia bacterium]|nr:condensation domain-containing protein [Thermoanaerobaculia bacterium]
MNDLLAKLAELSPKQRELLLRQLAKQKGETAPDRIPRQPRETDRFPVSYSQLREWILDRLEPGNPAYNIPGAFHVNGPFDLGVTFACADEIVRRHESLRTTFAATEGEPVQVVAPHLHLEVPVVDLSALPDERREPEAERLTRFERLLPFDLARGPLLRVSVLRTGAQRHIVLYTMHHIVSDGWSVSVFLREMAALYSAFVRRQPSPLPELPIQYPDYAVWQRGWLQGETLEKHLQFWRDQLAGAPPLLTLPTDRPRPAIQSYQGSNRAFVLSADLTRTLKAVGQREGATLFMTLLAGYHALLSRYSGQDDISVGTYSANRGRSELEGLIGFFINTLVLRAHLEDRPTFRGLLNRVKKVTVDAFAHQALPFEKVLETMRLDRNLSHTPLFQALLVLQNFPKQSMRTGEVELEQVEEEDHANFDLSFWLTEFGDYLAGTAQFNTDLFDAATVDRMSRHYGALLEAAVREPDRAVH